MRPFLPVLAFCLACEAELPPPAGETLDAVRAAEKPGQSAAETAPPPAESPAVPPPVEAEETPQTAVVALEPLTDAERGPSTENGRRRVGVHRNVPQPLPVEGAWIELDGKPVWRLLLRSPDAFALRLHFTEFDAGVGEVRAYEGDESRRRSEPRAYRGQGPSGDGDFWSDVFEGDTVVVEFRPGPGQAASGAPPFHLEQISHLWESPLAGF
ncbi:MAG: hypothetical protein GC160_05445 [Acidobacteria bacterium]|nr:hypothetical protein [Acidobacteriota bacterium]